MLFACLAIAAQAQSGWMRYSSISPDGQSIVFCYQGDIYRVAATGGTASPLTIHEGYDFMPVWSHDGKQLAFASNRYGNFDVFVMPSEGGSATRLTYHSSGDLPSDFSADDQRVIFSSSKMDLHTNVQFPTGALPELYSVPTKGGRIRMELPTSANFARFDKSGSRIIYEDAKSYENEFRKHQVSAFALDIWMYDVASKKHTKITDFAGDDRNPVFSPDGNEFYYLSEESGNFNVFRKTISGKEKPVQLTQFEKHPVRFLTIANNKTLCFSWHGELYTLAPGGKAQKVNVSFRNDIRTNDTQSLPVSGGISEFELSPNGKEVVFIFRGEVFVSLVDGSKTKRITNTPEQERSVSFHSDGRSLLYAGERNGSWNIYQASIERKEENYFHNSTLITEKALVATGADEFQPRFSPDGKEVAYLEERVILKVLNTTTGASRTILPAKHNYSYADGDQFYEWSPDSKWFLVQFIPEGHWLGEVGLIKADGKEPLLNLTQSGYSDGGGRWMAGGKMMIWGSDRDGMKNHASWGSEADVYGMFFTKAAYDRFRLSKEEFALLKEKEEKEEKEKAEKAEKEAPKSTGKKDDKSKDPKKEEPVKDLVMDLEGIHERKARLTSHSSRLSDAVLSTDGEKLYYLASFEKGTDLWETNLREHETKILAKLGANSAGGLQLSKDGKILFLAVEGNITKIEIEGAKTTPVAIQGHVVLNPEAERAYMYEHIWRQVLKKFYVPTLHGTDWEYYKTEYARLLPHINNNFDFTEMLSELLGELNASHTGAYFMYNMPTGDATAHLGAFYDQTFTGQGLKITDILSKGPLDKSDSKIKVGTIIEKIDGISIEPEKDYFALLNRKAGEYTLLSCYDPQTKVRFDETVKPINGGEQNELLYKRWVQSRNAEAERLSGGRVGYVHVRGMDDNSFRTVFEEVLGKHANKEALIVDTRFNGGGWLHDDLATFLSGKKYVDLVPRNQKVGFEPQRKWTKPSIVIMNEGNYSDAHFFPFVYKELGIGKLVGSPVPGTATAVWWENLIDPAIVFGIPQVGVVDARGNYLENQELMPDILVYPTPEEVAIGRDMQLEKAVEEMLRTLGK